MKYLVLCSALLLSISLFAQQAPGNQSASPDNAPVIVPDAKLLILTPDNDSYRKTLDSLRFTRPWAGQVSPGTRIWLADNLRPMCAKMRTYRVEREARDSDVTRPSGYSECVSMSKFRIEKVMPKTESADAVILPSE